MAFDSSLITGQIENFIQSAKKLEMDLEAERKRSHKIACEYVDVRGKLEKAVRALQSQVQQRDQHLQQLSKALADQKQSESILTQRTQDILETERKTRDELQQYKQAWAEVLARENAARNTLAENQKNRTELTEKGQQISQLQNELITSQKRTEDLSRHIGSYKSELKKYHERIQTSESRLAQLHREYQQVIQAKKSADAEIARLTQAFQAEQGRVRIEMERLRAEAERTLAADRERLKDLTRQTSQDQVRHRDLEQQNSELKERVRAIQMMMHGESERMNQQVKQLSEALQTASSKHEQEMEHKSKQLKNALQKVDHLELMNTRNQEAIVEMRTLIQEQESSLDLLRLEKAQIQGQSESMRKTLTKDFLVEKLRHGEEVEKLRAQIENLERADIRIQRIDHDPIDGEILMAHPIEQTRSIPNTEIRPGSPAPVV